MAQIRLFSDEINDAERRARLDWAGVMRASQADEKGWKDFVDSVKRT